jgi:cell division protein YceG involved in septum cleavage
MHLKTHRFIKFSMFLSVFTISSIVCKNPLHFFSFLYQSLEKSHLHFELPKGRLTLKAASHLSENRWTKGNEWGKCTRIQRIKNKFDFKLSDHKLLSNMINKQ